MFFVRQLLLANLFPLNVIFFVFILHRCLNYFQDQGEGGVGQYLIFGWQGGRGFLDNPISDWHNSEHPLIAKKGQWFCQVSATNKSKHISGFVFYYALKYLHFTACEWALQKPDGFLQYFPNLHILACLALPDWVWNWFYLSNRKGRKSSFRDGRAHLLIFFVVES